MATTVNSDQSASIQKWILVDRNRLGGTPVFSGTRVPINTLFDYLRAGDSIDVFLEHFPGVNREQVQAVIDLASQGLLHDVVNA